MRRKQKTGFTRDRHVVLGRALAAMDATLNQAVVDASHAYNVTGPEVRALERACLAIERARSVLDDAICRERPWSDVRVVDVYYPREDAEQARATDCVPPVPPGPNRWDTEN